MRPKLIHTSLLVNLRELQNEMEHGVGRETAGSPQFENEALVAQPVDHYPAQRVIVGSKV